jgi:hypothetical protein
MGLPEASGFVRPLPISWERRAKLWKKAFKSLPSLLPRKDEAIAFMRRALEEVEDRNFGAHAIWGEFVAGASEPTIRAKTVRARKGSPNTVDATNYEITLSLMRRALVEVNKLNVELSAITAFLGSLRPTPPGLPRV